MRNAIKRYAIVLAAWLPFFALWFLFAMLYAHYPLSAALVTSTISMGSASLMGIAVWHICQRWPWPLRLDLKFYFLQIFLASVYSILWSISVFGLEALRRGVNPLRDFWKSPVLGWQLLMGLWLYGLFAGVSYAVQTRNRLHEKEVLAARAEVLAVAARLDAIRARLNPHFLFNALHALAAMVKFHPGLAESAIERLGDMLRYTLKEDGREWLNLPRNTNSHVSTLPSNNFAMRTGSKSVYKLIRNLSNSTFYRFRYKRWPKMPFAMPSRSARKAGVSGSSAPLRMAD